MKPKGQDDASRWTRWQEANPSGRTEGEVSGEKSCANHPFPLESFLFPKETHHVPMTRVSLRALTRTEQRYRTLLPKVSLSVY